jgi:hypothetical protein
MGDRTIEAEGSIFFEDLTNNVKACVIFNTYKKQGFFKKTESGIKDEYNGLIYKCHPISNPNVSAKLLFSKSAEDVKDFKHLKDVIKPICEIKGSWLRSLTIDNQVYWDIDRDFPDR